MTSVIKGLEPWLYCSKGVLNRFVDGLKMIFALLLQDTVASGASLVPADAEIEVKVLILETLI
jgi:hypothetical protein